MDRCAEHDALLPRAERGRPARVRRESPMSEAANQPVRPPRRRTPGWLWALLLLLAIMLSPFYLVRLDGVVERLQYANTRGRQRALADDAHRRLAVLEGASETFRLVAQ